MKNLNESTKSDIAESAKTITVIWSHWEPNEIYFIENLSPELRDKLPDLDWNWEDINPRNQIMLCAHNDESFVGIDIKATNLDGIRKLVAKDVVKNFKEMEKEGQVYNSIILYSIDDSEWGPSILDRLKSVDDLKNLKPEDVADAWLEVLKNTKVDGDSSRAYYFVDFKKRDQIAGSGRVGVIFADPAEDEDIRHRIFGYE